MQGDDCIFYGVLAANELAFEAIPGERLAGLMLSDDYGTSVTREEWASKRIALPGRFYDRTSFEAAVEPAIKWLCGNANPHAGITIDVTGATLTTAELSHTTDKFIKD